MSNTEQPESTVYEYLTKDNEFLGNSDENPLEYILNITSIINLFQSPGVSSDQHDNSIEPILYQLLEIHEDDDNPALFAANSIDDEKTTPKLKELPSHLEYAFLDNNHSPWVSPIHVVPKKGGTTVIANKDNKLVPTRTVTGNEYYCFPDGFFGYFQISLAPEDQEKTTFTCPYGTFAYRRMPFRLCNAPATFQRCMTAIFHDMCKDFMEVLMDDFSVLGNSFGTCLNNLSKMLARWHKIPKAGIEVDKAKVDVIASLPYPTNVKGIQSFLGHAGFYRRFIKDFSKIARPMTQLLMKDTKFDFSYECIKSFDILRDKLITAPVIIDPNWDLDFELMCDVSDSRTSIRRIQDLLYTKLLEDIKRGPYSKKAQYAISHIDGYSV
ncbi:reverse transcriptase domain-containing protein [Tanacetum coccineum]